MCRLRLVPLARFRRRQSTTDLDVRCETTLGTPQPLTIAADALSILRVVVLTEATTVGTRTPPHTTDLRRGSTAEVIMSPTATETTGTATTGTAGDPGKKTVPAVRAVLQQRVHESHDDAHHGEPRAPRKRLVAWVSALLPGARRTRAGGWKGRQRGSRRVTPSGPRRQGTHSPVHRVRHVRPLVGRLQEEKHQVRRVRTERTHRAGHESVSREVGIGLVINTRFNYTVYVLFVLRVLPLSMYFLYFHVNHSLPTCLSKAWPQ